MIKFLTATAALACLATPSLAADAAKGEKGFKSCKACHTISSGDEVLYKGGKVGPNLYGIVGRQAGSVEGFKYGDDIIAAGEAGLIWDEETLLAFVADPKAFLTETLGKKAKSKMTFKKKNATDIVAYLASVSPAVIDEAAAPVFDADADAAPVSEADVQPDTQTDAVAPVPTE